MTKEQQRRPITMAALIVALAITCVAAISGMVRVHLHVETYATLAGPHANVLAHDASTSISTDETLVERLCDALRNCPCSSTWSDISSAKNPLASLSGQTDWPPPKQLRSIVLDIPHPPPELTLASTGEGQSVIKSTRSDG